MHIGLIGLGRMGHHLALNCLRNGHLVIGFDTAPEARKRAASAGITVVDSTEELVKALPAPRVIWLMITAGDVVDGVISVLLPFIYGGDILIDGGNSHYKDSVRRAVELGKKDITLLDCGSSGGVEGALQGLCLMVGGNRKAVEICEPFFKSISVEGGYVYCGESGSGHFVKMVHNGIEYGMMQSIAEGFELMEKSGFNLEPAEIAAVWNHGSVIRSWLMELTARIFLRDGKLEGIKGTVHSSGEGKWMVETAIEKNIPLPVITLSLLMRYRSQQEDSFSGKLVAALRREFGGHSVVDSTM